MPDAWRPAAVVWDLDGTLVESAPDLATALNALLAEHGRHGHPVESVRTMVGDGVARLIERGFRAAGGALGSADIEALVPRFMEIYSACATDKTHLVEGAGQALERLGRAGLRQGLCTNKPLDVTRQILQALGVLGYFGSVIGGDSTSHKKPHPQPLQACLAELGVEPAAALMVGDSIADVGSARAAGVRICLVADGYSLVPATALGADFVIGSLADTAMWDAWLH